jgi:glutamate transport system substrate-binding protein
VTRRIRTLGVLLAIAAMMVGAACGREGAPGAAPVQGSPVAQNVQVPGSPTFAAMQQRGRIVIGVKNDQPGLGIQDPTSGQYTGFDIEIGRMIAAGLGFAPEQIDYKVVPSAAREDAIARGDVDMYVGTYTISDSRKQRVSFAGPYYVAGQDLLIQADDDSIKGPDDLAGKKVCAASGSTPIKNIRTNYPTAQPVEFDTYTQCVDQLVDGAIDAVSTDDAILAGFAAEPRYDGKLKVVGKTFSKEPYGIGLKKGDNDFRAFLNDTLETSFDDGTWATAFKDTLGKSGVDTPEPPKVDRY